MSDTPIEQLGHEARQHAIRVAYRTLLHREPDLYGREFYGARLADGRMTVASMEADIKASPEYVRLHPPTPEPGQVPRLSIRGRQFVTDTGALYIPRWASGLTLLARTPDQQSRYLDWALATRFNGVRVFAGALTWAGQTHTSALHALPGLLDRAAERGLVTEVTALTDTGTGYDAKAHIVSTVGILQGRAGVLLELANEIGHHTQSEDITTDRMRRWGRDVVAPFGVLWAVGATLASDEPIDGVYAGHGGDYCTAHLDRGRETWNQVRRVREIYAIAEAHGCPAINNEPIGAAEPGTAGQRWNDPAMFFALGALDRAFGVGGVHHSQAGLMAELPGPVQQQCASAYVNAHGAIDAVLPGVVGQYKNVGHAGSPIASARFVEGGSQDGVVRAYSFVSGDEGVTVAVGLKGDAGLVWANGWRLLGTVASHVAADGRTIAIMETAR